MPEGLLLVETLSQMQNKNDEAQWKRKNENTYA